MPLLTVPPNNISLSSSSPVPQIDPVNPASTFMETSNSDRIEESSVLNGLWNDMEKNTKRMDSVSVTSMDSMSVEQNHSSLNTKKTKIISNQVASNSTEGVYRVDPEKLDPSIREIYHRLQERAQTTNGDSKIDSEDGNSNFAPTEQQILDLFFPSSVIRNTSMDSTSDLSQESKNKDSSVNGRKDDYNGIDTDLAPLQLSPATSNNNGTIYGMSPSSSLQQYNNWDTQLQDVLQKLRMVDTTLDKLVYFWANIAVILDLSLKKSDHVEKFVEYANNPKLRARFLDRISEYKLFWENIRKMCSLYGNLHEVAYSPSTGSAPGFDQERSQYSNESFRNFQTFPDHRANSTNSSGLHGINN